VTPISIHLADLADPAHRDAILRITDAYARDPIGRGRGLDPDAALRLVPGLQAHPRAFVYLAMAGGEPAGIATCFETFGSFEALPVINIHDLVVLPDFRRSGVGRRLLAAVEEHARRLGCSKITLEVKERNGAARRLYASFGFDDPGGEAPPESRRVLFLQKTIGAHEGGDGRRGNTLRGGT
jgi:GNAT superfamily N-acetyltransferase